jgi:hypothetical protein
MTNLETLVAALTPAQGRTPIAFEVDAAFDDMGRLRLDKLASDTQSLQAMREALDNSGTTKDNIYPIVSSNANAEDVAFFMAKPNRTHILREAVEGEAVLDGRAPASDFLVCVRQVQSGLRLSVAIPLDRMDVSPAKRPARLDDDDVLALLWEMASRAAPGHYLLIDKIVAHVDEMRSAAAADGLKRRLQ